LTPEQVRAWQEIFRDALICVVATFMLIWATVVQTSPNPYIIGAGLTLFGIPPALRLDKARRSRPNGDDPYDGPGGYYRDG